MSTELAKLRAELRELRKQTVKPVSRMRKGDISAELAQMRIKSDDTPAAGKMNQSGSRKMIPAAQTIKEAKRMEFPVKPSKSEMSAKKKAPASQKKMKIVEVEVTDSESDE
jgi:3-methyladenine DNA glycosylase AlkC